jgi:hypothetical protein
VGYVTGLSILVLLLQHIRCIKPRKSDNPEYVPPGGYVAQHGGATILTHQILRLSVNVLLSIATGLRLSDSAAGNAVVAVSAVCTVADAARMLSEVTYRRMPQYCQLSCSSGLSLNPRVSHCTQLSLAYPSS